MTRAIGHPTAALVAAVLAFALLDPAHATAQMTPRTPGPGHVAQTVSSRVDLGALTDISATDAAALERSPALRAHVVDSVTAAEASAWWRGLAPQQRKTLVRGAPSLIGMLDGVDIVDRVAANRVQAIQRVEEIDDRLAEIARKDPSSAPDRRAEREALWVEKLYFSRVVQNDIQLYLYEPDRGALIEMAGDPGSAAGLLFVVPGTNASMKSFMVDEPVTDFANWQTVNADPATPLLTFTVLAGPMPQVSFDLASGPQNNTIATAAGAAYARFVKGIDVVLPGLPTLSYEHSAGSQVGSAAEMAGARFDARFLAAGVGATDGYETVTGTDYYASQSAADVNRYYAGFQIGDIGYGVGPEEFAGITIVDPGFDDERTGAGDVAAMIWRGLDLHNRLFSGDSAANGAVLQDVRLLLTSLAHESTG